MNRRGEYGVTRAGADAEVSQPPATARVGLNLGIVGVGVVIGLFAWPSVRKGRPLGAIALGASGSMVAAGLISLFPASVWYHPGRG